MKSAIIIKSGKMFRRNIERICLKATTFTERLCLKATTFTENFIYCCRLLKFYDYTLF